MGSSRSVCRFISKVSGTCKPHRSNPKPVAPPAVHGNFFPYAPRTTHHAFSLVELSIVLVILGLLVGGVLAGKSLIRASQLRAYMNQYTGFLTAAQTFRSKYLALPGDMTNATQFWGLRTAGWVCMATASTDSKTCDGNGDGKINNSTNSIEGARFWQHLANASLIGGNYNGTAQKPATKLGGGYVWDIYYTGNITGNIYMYNGDYGNRFSTNYSHPPEEVYNIDVKLDDGRPATGKIVVYETNGAGITAGYCSTGTSSTDYAAVYALNSTVRSCTIMFRQQF